MNYKVLLDKNNRIVFIEANGLINTSNAEKMVLSAGIRLKLSNFHCCFFDLQQTKLDPKQSQSEMFYFAEIFKKANIPTNVKIAALINRIDEHRKILEKAAFNIGYQLKHFTVKNEALSWLLTDLQIS